MTDPEEAGGRGPVIVTVPARVRGVTERAVGKTVWAELELP
ncbi:hypothetical protein ACFW2X_15995 [Streptomyces antibioticus]